MKKEKTAKIGNVKGKEKDCKKKKKKRKKLGKKEKKRIECEKVNGS